MTMEELNDMEAPPLLQQDADWAAGPRRIALFVEPSPFAYVSFLFLPLSPSLPPPGQRSLPPLLFVRISLDPRSFAIPPSFPLWLSSRVQSRPFS